MAKKRNIGICLLLTLVVAALGLNVPTSYGADAKKMTKISISGGTIGGSSNLVANAWAGVAKKYMNLNSTVITYPTVAQVDAVLNGLADIATGLPDVAQEAYDGTGAYAGKPPRKDLRAMAYRQGTVLQILVSEKSNIKNIRDLKGKRVGTGKKGFSSDYNFKQIVEILGMSYQKDFKIIYMGHQESSSALIAGKMDAYVVSASLPHPSMQEVDMTHALRLVNMSMEDAQKVLKGLSYYEIMNVPANKYYHTKEPVIALNLPAFNVVTTAVPEDVVYGMMKNYMEHPDYVGLFYKPLEELIVSGTTKRWVETIGGIPWHAGAYKWYKEKGWKVVASRIPPEVKVAEPSKTKKTGK